MTTLSKNCEILPQFQMTPINIFKGLQILRPKAIDYPLKNSAVYVMLFSLFFFEFFSEAKIQRQDLRQLPHQQSLDLQRLGPSQLRLFHPVPLRDHRPDQHCLPRLLLPQRQLQVGSLPRKRCKWAIYISL